MKLDSIQLAVNEVGSDVKAAQQQLHQFSTKLVSITASLDDGFKYRQNSSSNIERQFQMQSERVLEWLDCLQQRQTAQHQELKKTMLKLVGIASYHSCAMLIIYAHAA